MFGNSQQSRPTGSLFGSLNTAPQQSTGGGLFGNLGAASTQAPQQQTGTGTLFGSLGAATTQAQTSGGLFGASTTQPAGLFGSTATQPQQQQTGTGGGLSFGLGSTTQPQQQQQGQQAGGGLFGASASQAPSGSLFAPTNQQASLSQSQQQNGASGAYFDAILEKSRKRAHDGDSLGIQLGLGDLRQRMKRLGPNTQGVAVDGKAHYLLAASGVDPGAAVRDLSYFNPQSGRVERTQPQEPERDTDVEGYLARLETQTTMSMISEGIARSVREFDVFLEDNVTMEWNAQRQRIYEHFGIKPRREPASGPLASTNASPAKPQQNGFGRSRRGGKGAASNVSRAANAGASTFGRSSMQKSVIGAAAPIGTANQPMFADMEKKPEAANALTSGPSDRFLREKQSRYIEKIQNLNEARVLHFNYPLSYELSTCVDRAGEKHASQIIRAYKILMQIVGEDPDPDKLQLPTAVKERQYAKGYLDDNSKSPESSSIRKRILRGSQSYLEKEFFETLEEQVAKNPREAVIGGIPTATQKVKAYIRLLAFRKDLAKDLTELQSMNNEYAWAVIFYLLRSGYVREAHQYVADNNLAFKAIDRNFIKYIAEYAADNNPDRKLYRDLQDRINSEYNQRLRIAPENSVDPFRMACYKIIGRCDLGNRYLDSRITQSQDDYMWLQFVLAREFSAVDEIASEAFGLATLQESMKTLTTTHIPKGSPEAAEHFGFAFFVLIASGLFEDAISWLYYYHETDAVHFAIALDFYGLLRVSDPEVEMLNLLSYTTRQQPQITFGRLIGGYTRDFRAANVTGAVDYLTLICLNGDLLGDAGRRQIALCHEALRELVLESREFALLLGDINGRDGQRVKGFIEERLSLIGLDNTSDFMRTITLEAASIADDNGRVTDAVLLYHLAEEYDNVVVVITRALSEAVAVPLGHGQMRLPASKPAPRNQPGIQQDRGYSYSIQAIEDPVQLAEAMMTLYSKQRMFLDKIRDVNRSSCEILLKMSRAKEVVEAQRWVDALDIIIALDILPLEAGGNPGTIRSYAAKFSAYPQAVAMNIPNLLMWTIMCCNGKRDGLATGQFAANMGTRRMLADQMKQMNMDMTTYCSQLRYRFPAHLHEALARAQSE